MSHCRAVAIVRQAVLKAIFKLTYEPPSKSRSTKFMGSSNPPAEICRVTESINDGKAVFGRAGLDVRQVDCQLIPDGFLIRAAFNPDLLDEPFLTVPVVP